MDPQGPPVALWSSRNVPLDLLSSWTVMSTVPPPQSTTMYRVPKYDSESIYYNINPQTYTDGCKMYATSIYFSYFNGCETWLDETFRKIV